MKHYLCQSNSFSHFRILVYCVKLINSKSGKKHENLAHHSYKFLNFARKHLEKNKYVPEIPTSFKETPLNICINLDNINPGSVTAPKNNPEDTPGLRNQFPNTENNK